MRKINVLADHFLPCLTDGLHNSGRRNWDYRDHWLARQDCVVADSRLLRLGTKGRYSVVTSSTATDEEINERTVSEDGADSEDAGYSIRIRIRIR